MKSEQLKALQTPLKAQYRENPESAVVTCKVSTGQAILEAGLHPASGGDGSHACSGDMLLEALVACAGVTLQAVATSLEINLRDASLSAEGDLDFRGTLAVAKDAPVGLRNIRLNFKLDTDAPKETIDKLIELTERYCVVLQTIRQSPDVSVTSEIVLA
jgi:uncharacterized OsmC-like protein